MNKTKNQVIDQQNENNENKNQSINPRQRDQRRLSIETLTALNRAAHDAMKEIQGDRTTAEAVSDSELYCDLMQISLLGYNRWLDYERKKQQYRDMKMDDLLKALYQRTKTLKWNQLLSAFLNTWLEARVPDFAPERPVSPAPLEKIVLEGGNFGHFAAQRQKAMTGSEGRRKADTLLRMLRRLPFSMKYAPGETISRLRALTNGNMRRR